MLGICKCPFLIAEIFQWKGSKIMVKEVSDSLRNEKSTSLGERERSGLEKYKMIDG